MSTHEITFQLQQTERDYWAAVEFAYKIAYHWYQCHPSEIPRYIFLAKERNQIIGTVGVTNDIDSILPLRKLYIFDHSYLPNDWDWESVVQLSWFFREKKGCFLTLLLKALQFCQQSNKQYAILQMKEIVFQILSAKGVKLVKIENAKLLLDCIEEEGKSYYLEATPVHLYYLHITDNIASIQNFHASNQLITQPAKCQTFDINGISL